MIVGGGFAGLWAVRTLAPVPADVVLIDTHNYHSFLPLLYQVAAAELEPEAIAHPLIGFRQRLAVLLAWAWDYLFSERVVRLILSSATASLQHQPDHGLPTVAETPRATQRCANLETRPS